jgi:Bacteriophage tail sheath protein
MPVTPSFPGLYIEELPLSAHSISPAPTSITVIVGSTHPIKTKSFREAVHLFSFTEYEREFGGMFKSNYIEPHVPLAVNQFFLNGGSDLYVVGLDTTITKAANSLSYKDAPELKSTLTPTGGSIVIRPLEPVDMVDMTITFNNVSATLDTFDLAIVYGRRVETFRGLTLGANQTLWKVNGASSLITVEDGGGKTDRGANFGSTFGGSPVPVTFHGTLAGYTTAFDPARFTDMFQEGTSLDKVPIFNILLTPGIFDNQVNSAALAFAERKRAFVILDAPVDSATDNNSPPATPITTPALLDKVPLSENGALYFPYLQSADPLSGDPIEVAPSGFVAGVFARTDNRRGVWKAPAGIESTLSNTTGVVTRGRMTNEQQGVIYGTIAKTTPVNCLRSFPGAGTVVFGARTLVGSNDAYAQSKYVPVRRMTLFIEQTLLANLRWVVFEPNDEPLWISIRTSIENFMLSLFNQHALQGSKPSDAFQVKCDKTTTTQDDINNGIVNIIVAFAPLKPAEFVIIKIAQLAGQTQTS